MGYGEGLRDLSALSQRVERGEVDTVVVAMTDMQGRLQGKRCSARYFLDEVVAHATEGCNYLLAVDVEMNTASGFAMSSWERGYGDFVLAEHGWRAYAGTELEFLVFRSSYEEAWRKDYRELQPANQYNVDYSVLGTARIEPLLRRIRNEMTGAGLYCESAKGECNLGQHEITFRYDEALASCDNHVVYKTGAKEIAAQEGMNLSFMAKYDEREGNSCHIHLSLRSTDGQPVFAGGDEHGMSPTMAHFLAGQLACLREFTLLLAPNVNSYKRFVPGSFAPTAVTWGADNRTCALRVVGHGPSLRFENRVPGGDVNPYLALAALVAAGLHGVEHELPLEPACAGNAYTSDKSRVPTSLREAGRLFADSVMARAAFGEEVVDHYVNAARLEVEAFDAAVTDWERRRGFERL